MSYGLDEMYLLLGPSYEDPGLYPKKIFQLQITGNSWTSIRQNYWNYLLN